MGSTTAKALRYGPCVTRDHTVWPATHTRTIPAFSPQSQGVITIWLVPIAPTYEGMARLSWPGWLATYREIYVPYRELNPDTITHVSTNRAQRLLLRWSKPTRGKNYARPPPFKTLNYTVNYMLNYMLSIHLYSINLRGLKVLDAPLDPAAPNIIGIRRIGLRHRDEAVTVSRDFWTEGPSGPTDPPPGAVRPVRTSRRDIAPCVRGHTARPCVTPSICRRRDSSHPLRTRTAACSLCPTTRRCTPVTMHTNRRFKLREKFTRTCAQQLSADVIASWQRLNYREKGLGA